jgi:methionine--tRNA ligase beta chain
MNITFEDFTKLDIRIGKIVSAEKVEGADKLLKLEVDFGSDPSAGSGLGKRQIVSGIAEFYSTDDLVGKLCPFIVNLEPRVIRGVESQGMIMAASPEGKAVLLHPDSEVEPGTIVK